MGYAGIINMYFIYGLIFCERVKNTDNVIRGIYKIIEFVSRTITE